MKAQLFGARTEASRLPATANRTLTAPCCAAGAGLARGLGGGAGLGHAAGRGNPPGSFLDWTPEQWREVVDVNLNGMFYCIQQAFHVMKDQSPKGGRIINNGSISAHAPRPNSIAYTATKHAVTGLTKAASLDGRKYNIAVGQLDIGNAATDMTTAFTQGVAQADGSIKVEPVMDVSHVAQALVYMANLPLSANVPFMTVMATQMPYLGRG